MATGYFNDSIFLLGGNAYGYQMLEYKVSESEFIDHGENKLNDNTFGFGQYYSQINDTIYIIDPDGDKLSVFHMNTKIFEKSWNNVVIPLDVSSVGCLASSSQYLFVVGGRDIIGAYLNTVQMLDVTTLMWSQNLANMIHFRGYLSCMQLVGLMVLTI
eukprot:234570_1